MTSEKHLFATLSSDGLFINVMVQPRASRNGIVGVYEDCLKIALTAPPVEGEANKACVRFISELLGINRSKITIVSGRKARKKRIFIKTENPSKLLELFPL